MKVGEIWQCYNNRGDTGVSVGVKVIITKMMDIKEYWDIKNFKILPNDYAYMFKNDKMVYYKHLNDKNKESLCLSLCSTLFIKSFRRIN